MAEFTTPVGRLVQGDLFTGNDKDRKGEAYVVKTGPNKGNLTKKFFFAVAYPKLLANGAPNEDFNNFYRGVIDVARAGYPQLYTGPVDPFTGKPGSVRPNMSYKIVDGDGVDENGVQNNTKPGHAGHWVVRFDGSFAPRVFELGKWLPSEQITDAARIKKGYYVSVNGTIEPNIGSDKPGVYVNGNTVCLVGTCPESEVIVGGVDAAAAFANIPMGSLPPGCVPGANPSNAPQLPNAGGVPTVPGASSVPAVPGTVPNVTVSAPPVAHDPLAVAVANGWIKHPSTAGYYYKGQDVKPDAEVAALYPAPMVPTVPAVPSVPTVPAVPVVPAVGPVLTAAGAALGTYESFKANGWDDALMRTNGYLV